MLLALMTGIELLFNARQCLSSDLVTPSHVVASSSVSRQDIDFAINFRSTLMVAGVQHDMIRLRTKQMFCVDEAIRAFCRNYLHESNEARALFDL